MNQHFEIIGTGLYLPRVALSAEDLDRRVGKPQGWTRDHIGVEWRHECVAPESLGSMAGEAARSALASAGLSWAEIDLIVDASASRHQPIPCNAAHLQAHFGPDAEGIPGFDIQGTCLGFILALHVANGLLAVGDYRHILIVCSEAALAAANWREPESAALLGDGAAAVVVRRCEPQATFCFVQQTFAQHLGICSVRGGAHNLPSFAYRPEMDAEYRFHMDGPRLLRIACKHLPPMTNRLLESAAVDRNQLQVIPHQASPRAVEMMRRLLGMEKHRYHNWAARFGNLVAASIPAVLHGCRAENIITRGDDVLLLGTSAGYAQAALIFRA
jgi:3-oxoacyl-[acyl-carrier-protein] synthase-3